MRDWWKRIKLRLGCLAFGWCPRCGGMVQLIEERGLRPCPPLYCPKCDLHYTAF